MTDGFEIYGEKRKYWRTEHIQIGQRLAYAFDLLMGRDILIERKREADEEKYIKF